MPVAPTEIDKILILLAETPQRLASMTGGLDNTRLQVGPDQDAWSVNEILGHLRACADVWGRSIEAMISQEHPTLRYVSPRTRMRKANYSAQEYHNSLAAFTEQREDLLQVLNALKIEDWSRGATFTGTARGREQTVFSYTQRLAGHEAQHLDQVEDVLNAT